VRRESLIGVCASRAVQAHAADVIAAGRRPDAPPTKRESMRALWEATNVGSRVAAFILMWAIALDELGVDELSPETFAEWGPESRATVYRRLSEFRRLFPEQETPDQLAGEVLRQGRRSRGGPTLATSVPANLSPTHA